METEVWKHILVNGKSKHVQVLEPNFTKGVLQSIKGLRPFDKKDDKGNPIEPTISDANSLKRSLYIEFFKKPFRNLIVLSGAGTSMDVGGPSMNQLWAKAEEKYSTNFDKIKTQVGYNEIKPDIEALLSHIEGYIKFAGDVKVNLSDGEINLTEIRKALLDIIKTNCSLPKPTVPFPHKIFLEKLLQRKQTSPRIKIFTSNYDLMFEYAATEVNAVIIDGFSFTLPRVFSGRFFDYDIVQREGSKLQEEDNFIQRVFHLHKLHGSLNWERKKETNEVFICENSANPLLIYPREAKYEDSYEQPFFEMMARFQRNLRLSGDTLLLVIGYSFNDKHINAAIEESLNQNPGFRLAVIDPFFDNDDGSASLRAVRGMAMESERILMVSEAFSDFANFFPEIRTYETENFPAINLTNDRK